tara:strand:- start:150 stop:689 length:540 start_codon:yes stop_codon:yes gene_type:complete
MIATTMTPYDQGLPRVALLLQEIGNLPKEVALYILGYAPFISLPLRNVSYSYSSCGDSLQSKSLDHPTHVCTVFDNSHKRYTMIRNPRFISSFDKEYNLKSKDKIKTRQVMCGKGNTEDLVVIYMNVDACELICNFYKKWITVKYTQQNYFINTLCKVNQIPTKARERIKSKIRKLMEL